MHTTMHTTMYKVIHAYSHIRDVKYLVTVMNTLPNTLPHRYHCIYNARIGMSLDRESHASVSEPVTWHSSGLSILIICYRLTAQLPIFGFVNFLSLLASFNTTFILIEKSVHVAPMCISIENMYSRM